ncbi:MAG: transmembrane 220 family protein [Gemmatimonadota bacterium]|nr:transmembrane 220 family protein [Gemmatimonadota bacterium]
MTGRFWTLANGIMLVMFVFSAAVQLNDPDPLAWMAIYGGAAVVCGLEIRRQASPWAPVAVAVIALAWAGSVYFRVHEVPISSLFAEWEMRDLRTEEAREMYGLAIVGIWMIVIVSVRWARARIAASARRTSNHR